MVEAEVLIGHLRSQVRNLQSLLNYLESRPAIDGDDYAYSRIRLRELVQRLKELERFSAQRGEAYRFRATWLN
ncbi:MAG: hypothetical protein COV75_00615 [Candidatus Omnitrophica bacterium CG11_big_fil_rev_8_21_14_0_20_63_9]|nr:MAG: hypothetical protein COV75_00615 [Candidatus Omnitrophica bacterium CG11_big_fil_rev_8_21_14_0_20_63_9]